MESQIWIDDFYQCLCKHSHWWLHMSGKPWKTPNQSKNVYLLLSPETSPFIYLLCEQNNPGGYKSIQLESDERALSEFSVCQRKKERERERERKRGGKGGFSPKARQIFNHFCPVQCWGGCRATKRDRCAMTVIVESVVVWFAGSCSMVTGLRLS